MESNLKKRIITILWLLPIFVLFHVNAALFTCMLFLLATICSIEWGLMISANKGSKTTIVVLGMSYILFPLLSLNLIYMNRGLEEIVFIYALVFTVDISAYVFGNILQGPKLFPQISPNKTISGFVSSMICGFIVLVIFNKISLINLALPFLAQLGDFLESYIKRKFKVKDSGKLFPGHGGLLDRFDSFVLVLPYYWIFHG